MSITNGNLHGIRLQASTVGTDDGLRHFRRVRGGSDGGAATVVAGKERAEVAFAGSVEAREEERLGEEEVRWLGMALERGEAMEGAARTC